MIKNRRFSAFSLSFLDIMACGFGAVTLLVLEEALSSLTEHWEIILGPLLLLVVLFARGGVDGLLAKAGAAVRS